MKHKLLSLIFGIKSIIKIVIKMLQQQHLQARMGVDRTVCGVLVEGRGGCAPTLLLWTGPLISI